jgi:site-specific recombinase XerD
MIWAVSKALRRGQAQGKTKGKSEVTFAYAFKSFAGHLEGTEKSLHTIKNYRSDLVTFQEFLEGGLGQSTVPLTKLSRADLEKYHDYLKAQGLKTNTRRRKLLTVRKLLKYLAKRKKISLDVGRKLPAPHKIERVPLTLPYEDLLGAIRGLTAENDIQARNRALLWTLLETGCLVSEVTRIRFSDWSEGSLSLGGKSPRSVPISRALYDEVQRLRFRTSGSTAPWLFLGHNKFGALGSAISPRGVELLVKVYAQRLDLKDLTPRTFRHTAVLHWFRQGLSQDAIQKRLGLKTAYAFRVFQPLLKSVKAPAETAAKSSS